MRKLDFEQIALGHVDENLLTQSFRFLRANKKWWLIPILLMTLFITVAAYLSSSAAAPFIYTLF